MEVSKFKLWMFYFLDTCKEITLTNKSIQVNLFLKSKRFPRTSTGYSVCHYIDSLKAGCKLSNKREPVYVVIRQSTPCLLYGGIYPYRENPSKKQAPLGDIPEPSFKVKFPCPNTPSPKGGGLREGNFIITQTLNFFATKTFTFKKEHLSNHREDMKRQRSSYQKCETS